MISGVVIRDATEQEYQNAIDAMVIRSIHWDIGMGWENQ